MNGLHKAIQLFGSQRRLALALNLSPMAISHWMKTQQVPYDKAIRIEQATQGAVPRWELRPDLWERPTSPQGKERE
ncbi:transcriptional regulator [Acidithiobacillus ferriphilus]|uniref:transcriptional regulator n=1 Tax=Acidithiobacillus ferriphilus TaxID=1689834 RepID=UPI001C079315|nr:Cro/CI family transcriptional regulator [Acidithiobacillus ferriphilus]MBU2852924.1 helix-turn-helix domain-containing protein [Acidithiobacillus ferriphilus]